MRKLLNTLYITRQRSYLSKEGDGIHLRDGEGQTHRIPLAMIEGVVCFGAVTVSPFLMGHCADNGVSMSFLTETGRFLARVEGRVSGNVLLRRAQHRASDDPATCRMLAVAMAQGKLANARMVLQRGARDQPNATQAEKLRTGVQAIGRCLRDITGAPNTDTLRGIEGAAGTAYFSAFDALLSIDDPKLRFDGRNRRPPRDAVNALLSFLYTLLAQDVAAALEGVGLDPQIGFLHTLRPGRASLALDMMEELRPIMADRLAISLLNRRQLDSDAFDHQPDGAVFLNEAGRKTVITAYQERKQQERRHPFLRETVPWGLVAHLQALLLARHLRGDLDGYPPYLWR